MEIDKASRILQNIHASLKWTWQIIMGFALVCAVEEYFSVLYNSNGNIVLINYFLFLFVLTFVRFLFGNNRYLDERYIEFFDKIENFEKNNRKQFILERTKKLSGIRRFF